MAGKHWFTALLSTLLINCETVNASERWSGYINNKSLNGEPYGYVSSLSNSRPASKLRLLCHSDDVFALYFDQHIIADSSTTVDIAVDNLPVVSLAVERVDAGLVVSNQQPDFWKLIAQMAAGLTLVIDSGVQGWHQFSLSGFTNALISNCGWSSEVEKYQTYLHHYR